MQHCYPFPRGWGHDSRRLLAGAPAAPARPRPHGTEGANTADGAAPRAGLLSSAPEFSSRARLLSSAPEFSYRARLPGSAPGLSSRVQLPGSAPGLSSRVQLSGLPPGLSPGSQCRSAPTTSLTTSAFSGSLVSSVTDVSPALAH